MNGEEQLWTGDALVVFDEGLKILSWNEAAEQLTGIPAEEALGQPCWRVLAGVDERWATVCHDGCSAARLAGEGRPVPEQRLLVRSRRGRRPLSVSTVAVTHEARTLFFHVMKAAWPGEGAETRKST